jgi:hypothetical protein
VEAADAVDGVLDGGDHLGFDRIERGRELGRRGGDAVGHHRRLVELLGEARQRRIALGLHCRDDRLHLLYDRPEIGLGAHEKLGALGRRQLGQIVQAYGFRHDSRSHLSLDCHARA